LRFEGPTLVCVAGGKYRGRLAKDIGFLQDVIDVIAGIVYLQVSERPLRHHIDFFDEADEEIFAAIAPPAREVIDGYRIGTVRDISRLDDGTLAGPGDEPSDRAVNTGCTLGTFQKGLPLSRRAVSRLLSAGDPVLIWWWGLFWRGTVLYVDKRESTLHVKFDWSGKTCSGYNPRLVYKLRR
jgi:hypothetical protein